MSKYKVYNRSGSIERCTLNKVEYNGSFMDSRVVNASVESSTPIEFDIYDYITYRGEKFELDYKPTSTKNASTGSTGNAYVYELIFVSLKYELERCEMRDLVPYDNGIVYPTPLTIEFTGTAEKLAERIQACLDELYTGSQKWTITVVSGVSDEEKNISISQANCWSAVSLFNTEYGLDFYIYGRTITVGITGAAIDFTFQYGKGKGLYKIERTSDSDQGIVTRLRAYGGTRNIGDNYLRDKTEWPNSTLPASMYLPNLMLPGFETTGIDYLDADNIAEYGIREGSVVYEDIYPSIVGTTNSKGQRIDRIQSAESITDDTASEFWITTYDLEFEKPLGDYIVTGGIPTIYIRTGQLQGYSFEINTSKIEEQEDGGYKLYLSRNTDNGFTVPNKDVNLAAGTEFVFLGIAMPKSYIEAAEDRLLARAEEYLAKYSQTNYGYEIGLDEIFAARNPSIYDTLYEGKKLRVVDADLGIDEEITIQSLSITEEDGSIPVYRITLNNEVSASTLNRIQGQVSQLESTVTNGFTLLQWQTQQYIRRSMRPYALWTRDGTTMWLYIDEEKLFATLDATLASNRDVICYATEDSMDDLGIPVSTNYNTTGLFRAKEGGGLLYDNTANAWYVDPDFQGGGGGIDESQLAAYLTRNNYVTQKYLTDNGYLKLSSPLTGYQKPSGYSPITAADTLLTAIGKLEANFGNYVDLTTNQTVGGVKTFTERVLSQKDVVAYAAADDGDLGLPVAGYSTTGLVRIKDGGGIVVDSSGVISVDPDYAGGGGVNFTPGNALQLTSSGVLNVLIGTTSGTVCAGNDSRLTTAYNQSHTHSNKSVLDGITSGYVSNWNTAYNLSHSHSNKSVLDGISSSDVSHWDNAYNNAHWHTNKSYLDVINQNLSTGSSVTFLRVYIDDDGGTWRMQVEPSGRLTFALGNTAKAYIDDGNIVSMGDVVAYATGSSLSDFVPVATTSTYGLVRYDGTTIGKNSSGQLYVISGSSGGRGSSVSWGTSSGNTIYLYVDGVSERLVLASGITVSGSGSQYRTVNLVGAELDLSLNGHTHSQYLTSLSRSTTGSGNVVTNVAVSGSTITVSYGNVSGGGTSVSWGTDTGNTVYLSVAGTQKQLTLAGGFYVNRYTNYATLKIAGATVDVSLNGHTHSQYLTSLSVSDTQSGNVVSDITVSGSRITVYRTTISSGGGGSWNGGTVSNAIQCPRLGIGGSSSQFNLAVFGSSYIRDKLLINTTSSSYTFALNGNGVYTGTWEKGSDIRYKTIVSDVEGILKKILTTRVFRYYWKGEGPLQIGVSAQGVMAWMPEVVGTKGEFYSLDYSAFATAVAIQGIKELYARFRPVENRVKVLESRVRNLQQRLDNAYREIFNLKEGKEDAA